MTSLPSIACLQSFESVARHGSVSRASVELNLTQSAVSRQIHQLEGLLDVALFERVRQRMVITDAGRLYLKDVNRVLVDLKSSTSRVMACGGNANLLNLAVLPTFATQWLVPRLSGFLQRYPDVTVNFSTRSTQFDFEAEPFDAAIHYGSPNWPGAVAYHLMDEETVPVCSPKFETAHRIRKPADLTHAVLLHQSTRTEAWSEWFKLMGINNSHPLRGPRFEQFGLIAQAAVCGLGVALLPKLLIEDELTSGKLSLLFTYPIRSTNSYYVVAPEAKASAPLTASFIQWMIHEARTADQPVMQKNHKRLKKY
ncbi:LysR family transcriptional regulator [Edaphobacter flagellatus]|uniref:LysR family transcriptional regulator n=1 Tax=Edaphobacter flagellatus TaxID=1933044 RepID=UPI0021B16CD2|nr:LysR family transcriptional regulator [Edaphobacter flagellatus]